MEISLFSWRPLSIFPLVDQEGHLLVFSSSLVLYQWPPLGLNSWSLTDLVVLGIASSSKWFCLWFGTTSFSTPYHQLLKKLSFAQPSLFAPNPVDGDGDTAYDVCSSMVTVTTGTSNSFPQCNLLNHYWYSTSCLHSSKHSRSSGFQKVKVGLKKHEEDN